MQFMACMHPEEKATNNHKHTYKLILLLAASIHVLVCMYACMYTHTHVDIRNFPVDGSLSPKP